MCLWEMVSEQWTGMVRALSAREEELSKDVGGQIQRSAHWIRQGERTLARWGKHKLGEESSIRVGEG